MAHPLQNSSTSLYRGNHSTVLVTLVDQHMAELKSQSRFFAQLRQGIISPEVMAQVLSTIIYALRYTPVHLQRAQAKAEELGLDELSQFFKEKSAEEYHHDEWALADLKALPGAAAIKERARPVRAVIDLMDYLSEVINRNPVNYLAYIFMNEHIAVTVFPELIEQLDTMCGISRQQVTVLTKHVELDRQHSQDDAAILAKYFTIEANDCAQRRMKAAFIATLYQGLSYYEQMFEDFSELTLK